MRALNHTFEQPDLEARFREASFPRDVRLTTRLLAISVLFQMVSMPVDAGLLSGAPLATVAVLRVVGILAAVAAAQAIRSGDSIRSFDLTVTGWMLVVAGQLLMVSALLPPEYLGQLPWHVLLVLGAYCVPVPLTHRASVAMLLSVANVLMFAWFKHMPGPAVLDTTAAFLCANLIGLFAGSEVGLWSREHFASFLEAKERESELKELRKIIPVCSSCQQVRTDDGYWEVVEEFLAEHPDARASRGICPNCVGRFYPTLVP